MIRSFSMVALATVLAAPAALAQLPPSGTNGANIKPAVGVAKPRSQERSPIAPQGLPGSRAEKDEVAPASKLSSEMPPTEALFDAINRGDLASAKDAVNRGADIYGTNVLGLTPLEQSVDLGRNQISFLLLSLRGGGGYTTSRGPVSPDAGKPPSRAEQLAAARAERAEKTAQTRRTAADALPAAPRTAQLFAGNGGAPVPQAGFLGFDAGR